MALRGLAKIVALSIVLACGGCGSITMDSRMRTEVSRLREANARMEDNLQILAYAALVRTNDSTASACLDAIIKIVGYPNSKEMERAKTLTMNDIENICSNSEALSRERDAIRARLDDMRAKISAMESGVIAVENFIKKIYKLAFFLLLFIIIKKIF